MINKPIGLSELIINEDGSIYHLKLKPEHVAEKIILVGDPGRVESVSRLFSNVEIKISNREFIAHTGYFNNTRFTVLSTGIGTDNIDIVLNELDALVNIDFKTRIPCKNHRTLQLIRLGTSGAVQKETEVNSIIASESSIGFDGLLNYYADRNKISDLAFEKAFKKHTQWSELLPSPYIVKASHYLLNKLAFGFTKGINISASGFYGPQGRVLRLPLHDPLLNKKIEQFEFVGSKITNYEMESSALYGLSSLLGHEALTVCVIIANRVTLSFSKNYHQVMDKLIEHTLTKLSE
jgi:uridine phosphorylase